MRIFSTIFFEKKVIVTALRHASNADRFTTFVIQCYSNNETGAWRAKPSVPRVHRCTLCRHSWHIFDRSLTFIGSRDVNCQGQTNGPVSTISARRLPINDSSKGCTPRRRLFCPARDMLDGG